MRREYFRPPLSRCRAYDSSTAVHLIACQAIEKRYAPYLRRGRKSSGEDLSLLPIRVHRVGLGRLSRLASRGMASGATEPGRREA